MREEVRTENGQGRRTEGWGARNRRDGWEGDREACHREAGAQCMLQLLSTCECH